MIAWQSSNYFYLNLKYTLHRTACGSIDQVTLFLVPVVGQFSLPELNEIFKKLLSPKSVLLKVLYRKFSLKGECAYIGWHPL
jgi:hypothetical protein